MRRRSIKESTGMDKGILFFIPTVLWVMLSSPTATAAKKQASVQVGCALIDAARQSQYISYEGTSNDSDEVRLSLHNNTTCSITIETDDRSPTSLHGVKGVLPVQVRLPLHYLIQDTHARRVAEPAYGWGDSVFTYELGAGQAALFSVPATYVRRRLDVVVQFNYAWERARPVGVSIDGVTHHVYFSGENLPQSRPSGRGRKRAR
jgi:hypothetical protein